MKSSARVRNLLGASALALLYYAYTKRANAIRRRRDREELLATGGDPKKKKVAVDKEFLRKLRYLIKIIIPSLKSKEFLLLLLHTGFLVARTFLSIYVAKLDGVLVKTIVDRNKYGFLLSLGKWIGVGVPATYVNAMIRYLESKLTIAFRSRLTQHALDQYMRNDVYYRVSNLDDRITNADQCLTSDIANFCEHCAHLYSHISKPILDVLLMTGQLVILSRSRKTQSSGAYSASLGIAAIFATNKLLRAFAPPFGRYIQEIANREGDYRACHARLITHSEEVAFYGGQKAEKSLIEKAYRALVRQQNILFRMRIPYNTLEGFLMKYVWGASGMLMIAIPAFSQVAEVVDVKSMTLDQIGTHFAEERSTRTQDYIVARRLLVDTADAIERVMSSYKEIMELAGYVARVYDMFHIFEDVSLGRYSRRTVTGATTSIVHNSDVGSVIVDDNGGISLNNVPIVTPNGDLLVKSMSFEVKPGMHLLITGPNGCGKSSLFRILGGLWPVQAGSVQRPSSIFYIPQKAYLVSGTLRDQVLYPDTPTEMELKGITDSDLEEIFHHVHLRHILQREGGWNSVKEWQDVLSGGEKQRLAMARLFYHRPKYAILDECTSAVSIDVEGKMYTHASDLGISLMTVTHRPSLWKYHNFLLQFDGEGGWKFSPMNAEERMSLKEEKSQIEGMLAGVTNLKRRLEEICQLLGESSVLTDEIRAPKIDEDEEQSD